MILGLDISTSLGWAVRDLDGKLRAHGVLALKGGAGGGTAYANLDKIRRLVKVAMALAETPAGQPGQLYVAVEGVDFSSRPMAHASYWRIRTLVEMAVLDLLGYEQVELVVPVQTLKVHAMAGRKGTGPKSRVSKDDMIARANELDQLDLFGVAEAERRGVPKVEGSRNGDRADAIHVTHWALGQLRAQG